MSAPSVHSVVSLRPKNGRCVLSGVYQEGGAGELVLALRGIRALLS